jgi:hypothetical protein
MKERPVFVYLPFRKEGQFHHDDTLFYLSRHNYKPRYLEWVEERFGPPPVTRDIRNNRWTHLDYCPAANHGSGTCIVFRDKEDAMMFKLAWGGIVGI